jgi:hypothetical protein
MRSMTPTNAWHSPWDEGRRNLLRLRSSMLNDGSYARYRFQYHRQKIYCRAIVRLNLKFVHFYNHSIGDYL